MPTLIVQGTRDTFGGPDECARPSSRDVGDAPIEDHGVEGGDHSFAVLEVERPRPADVHAEIQDWDRGVGEGWA